MKTIRDVDVENKTVIVRVDYNVPVKDGKVVDNNRIKASLETINYLIEKKAKIILMSHMGKVKTEEDKANNTLLPVRDELEKLLGKKVQFSEELVGEELENKIDNLKSKDILLLENTRYLDVPKNLESGCDKSLSFYWSSLCDVFILDAFASSHRAHASTYGISLYKPNAIGFLVEKEISFLDKVKNSEKILILGGAKVSDKIGVIKNLLPTSRKVLVGGAMCATFLRAKGYNVGNTFVDNEKLDEIKLLLNDQKIILPVDVVTENGVKTVNNISEGESILDIGPETIGLFKANINVGNLILMNGTMGKYEDEAYSGGTKAIFEYLSNNNARVIVCGGDTGAAAKKFNYEPYYLSTGGGASLEYLEGKEMLPLEIMK